MDKKAFEKNMNEHVAQVQTVVPNHLGLDKGWSREYFTQTARDQLADFIINESGKAKVEIQESESGFLNAVKYRASVAILSVGELEEFYAHITRLEEENLILKGRMDHG